MKQSISRMLNKIFVQIQNITKSKLWEFNMTPAQIRILMFIGQRLERGEKTFQKDIEREFNIKGSSVTSTLNKLEKNKWIRRESVDYDARLKLIVFAEQTYAEMNYMNEIAEKFDNMLKDSLSEAEFIVFCQCAEKILKTLTDNRNMLMEDSANKKE